MSKKKVAVLASQMLAALAVVFVSTASWFITYRPETPDELKKKA
ncbi:cyclic lactone autoinducer peptide [Cohnella caldifontis]|nr:cyclic lactone autoinducer peptide [Cohnella sp. YIM B05605]